jgi:hypothetical protein
MANDEQAARALSVDVIDDSLDADSDEILFVRPKPPPQCPRSPLSVADSLDDVCLPLPCTDTHTQHQPIVTTNTIERNTAVRLFDSIVFTQPMHVDAAHTCDTYASSNNAQPDNDNEQPATKLPRLFDTILFESQPNKPVTAVSTHLTEQPAARVNVRGATGRRLSMPVRTLFDSVLSDDMFVLVPPVRTRATRSDVHQPAMPAAPHRHTVYANAQNIITSTQAQTDTAQTCEVCI